MQRGPNPPPHFGLIVSGGNEDRPESSVLDLIVVWPATRTVVLPVPAERDGHRGADRGRIGPFADDHRCLMDVGLRHHVGSVVRPSEQLAVTAK